MTLLAPLEKKTKEKKIPEHNAIQNSCLWANRNKGELWANQGKGALWASEDKNAG